MALSDDCIELPFPAHEKLHSLSPTDNLDALLEHGATMNVVRETATLWLTKIYMFIVSDTSYIVKRGEEEAPTLLKSRSHRALLAELEQDAEAEAERNGTALLTNQPARSSTQPSEMWSASTVKIIVSA